MYVLERVEFVVLLIFHLRNATHCSIEIEKDLERERREQKKQIAKSSTFFKPNAIQWDIFFFDFVFHFGLISFNKFDKKNSNL